MVSDNMSASGHQGIAGKILLHHRSMTMMLAVMKSASSFQLTWEKKGSMVDPNYGGFQANALWGNEVRAGFVEMSYASPSSGRVPISLSLHLSYQFFGLQ